MNTTLTIKTPKKLRDDVKKTADRLGVPVTTVVNALLLQFVRDESITLSLKPRPEKISLWEEASNDMDAHPEKYPSYGVEEFIAKMDAMRKKPARAR